jgi:hypothetical protein
MFIVLYLHICSVAANVAEHFDATNEFIGQAKSANKRVLVHCRAGVSRSASLVLAYLLHSSAAAARAVSLREALEAVIAARPIICPNAAFRSQLIAYEFSLLNSNSLSSEAEMLRLIQVRSKMYSGDHTSETDLDRMPIQALKTRKAESAWDWKNAYADESTATTTDRDRNAGRKASSNSNSSIELVECASTSTKEAADNTQRAAATERVAKKPFLKRDPNRIVRNKGPDGTGGTSSSTSTTTNNNNSSSSRSRSSRNISSGRTTLSERMALGIRANLTDRTTADATTATSTSTCATITTTTKDTTDAATSIDDTNVVVVVANI